MNTSPRPFLLSAFCFLASGFEVPGPRSRAPGVRRHVLLTLALALMATCQLFAADSKYRFLPYTDPNATNVPPVSPFAPSSGATNVSALDPSALSQVETNDPAAGVTNAMDALDDKHKLAIGDRLSFRIVEDEEDPKPLFVTDSGDLEVPYLGRFPAVGKTCHELALDLKAGLEKEYYYQATVIVAVDVMAKSRGKVYLVGPVRMPGPQEIPSDEILTLSKAILRAGGFNDFADKHKVKVTRKPAGSDAEKSFTIDVGEVLEKGRTESDLPLEAGDLIYVPERLIRF